MEVTTPLFYLLKVKPLSTHGPLLSGLKWYLLSIPAFLHCWACSIRWECKAGSQPASQSALLIVGEELYKGGSLRRAGASVQVGAALTGRTGRVLRCFRTAGVSLSQSVGRPGGTAAYKHTQPLQKQTTPITQHSTGQKLLTCEWTLHQTPARVSSRFDTESPYLLIKVWNFYHWACNRHQYIHQL